ncbi:hypothetical protein ACQY0O_008166 [Thecaphora frezii]
MCNRTDAILIGFIPMTPGRLYPNLTCTDSLKSRAAVSLSSALAAPVASSAQATTLANNDAAASFALLPLARSIAVMRAVAALAWALIVVA